MPTRSSALAASPAAASPTLNLATSLSKSQLDRIDHFTSTFPTHLLPPLGTPTHDLILTYSHDLDHAAQQLSTLLATIYSSDYNSSLPAFERGILYKDNVAYKLELLTHLLHRQLAVLPTNQTVFLTRADLDRVALVLVTVYTSVEVAMVATFGSDGAFVCMPDICLADWLCLMLDRVRTLLARGEPVGRRAVIMLSKGKYGRVAEAVEERQGASWNAVKASVQEAHEAAARACKAAADAARAATEAAQAAAKALEYLESLTQTKPGSSSSSPATMMSALATASKSGTTKRKHDKDDAVEDRDEQVLGDAHFTELVRRVIDLAGEDDDQAINDILIQAHKPTESPASSGKAASAKRSRSSPAAAGKGK